MMRRIGSAALLLGALLVGAAGAAAQQPPAPAPPAAGGDDPATELVKQINADLEAVDKALEQATDAETAKTPLDQARASHLQAIRDIEELVKQVKYRKSKSGRSDPKPSPNGKSGSGGVKGKPEPRENDASSAPTPQKGSKSPQDQPEPEPTTGEKEQPKGGGKDGGKPEQRDGQVPPPPDPLGRFQRTDTDARWGLLPPKMQERLMNLHVDDVPERYRAWLESYIHALNRLEEQGGGATR